MLADGNRRQCQRRLAGKAAVDLDGGSGRARLDDQLASPLRGLRSSIQRDDGHECCYPNGEGAVHALHLSVTGNVVEPPPLTDPFTSLPLQTTLKFSVPVITPLLSAPLKVRLPVEVPSCGSVFVVC